MRYLASEKLEIIRLVNGSHLPMNRTLDKLGIPRTTFYRWYDRYLAGGPEALEDRSPRPSRVRNRIPEPVREKIKDPALKESDLSPRELALQFTDTEKYFVSEASIYRILELYDLTTSLAYVALSAADAFKDKTTRPNQLWQTDFTCLKIIGWGWSYLSSILDDYSRYIIAWKLCTTMKTGDVTDTLDLALQASGCDQATVLHKPRLLSDNSANYISGDLANWLEDQKMDHVRGAPYHPQTQGKIAPSRQIALQSFAGQWLASDVEEPHPAGKIIPPGRPPAAGLYLRRSLQLPPLPREHAEPHTRRRLLWARTRHSKTTRKDQTKDHRNATLASPQVRRIINPTR